MSSDNDPDPIVTKTITVNEIMDADGTRWIVVEAEGEPELWDAIGMLTYALESYRTAAADSWLVDSTDDDD